MPNDELQALGLLGNALALPKRLENASQQSAMMRALLSQNADTLGLTPAQIDQLAPDPGLGAINPSQHPGTYGKILSGVGGVGNVISSLLGSPLEPPRLDLSTITSLSSLRDKAEKKKATEAYAGSFPDEQSQAAIRAGKTPPRSGTGTMQEIPMLYRQGKRMGMSDDEANDYALEQIDVRRVERAGAQGRQASQIRVDEATLKDTRKAQLGAARVNVLLKPLEGAIDRLLTSDSLVGRLGQGAQLWAFKQAPGTYGRQVLGLNPKQIREMSEDIAVLESPGTFAGQLLKGLGEDAGRLSDYDIRRVTDRMPGAFDAGPTAQAKYKVFKRMVQSLASLSPEMLEEAQHEASRAVDEFDSLDEGTPGAPGSRVFLKEPVHVGTSAAPPVAGAAEDFEILSITPRKK